MQILQTSEVRVCNVFDSRRGVGNDLDRGRVDVVVDDVDKMPAHDVPIPNTSKGNTSTKRNYKHLQTKRKITITDNTLTAEHGPLHVGCSSKQHDGRPRQYNKYCCCRKQHT